MIGLVYMRNFRRVSKRSKSKKKRGVSSKSLFVLVGVILTLVTLIVFVWGYSKYRSRVNSYNTYQPVFAPGDLEKKYYELNWEQSFNALFVGSDVQSSGHVRSDMIILVHYDLYDRLFRIVNIPTDVLCYSPTFEGYYSLDKLWSLGQLTTPVSSFKVTKEAIEYNYGLLFDAYVVADKSVAQAFFDILGNIGVQNEQETKDLGVDGIQSVIFDNGELTLSPSELLAFLSVDDDSIQLQSQRKYSSLSSLVKLIDYAQLYRFADLLVNEGDFFFYSNLSSGSVKELVKFVLQYKDASFKGYFFPENGLKLSPEYENQKILDVDISDEFISSVFNNPEVEREQARIEIHNSTSISGLAGKYSRIIQNWGGDVIRVTNVESNYEKSVVFVKDVDSFSNTLDNIQKTIPGILIVNDDPGVLYTGDMIVVLGNEFVN